MRLLTSILTIICLTIMVGVAAFYFDSLHKFINRRLPLKYNGDDEFALVKKYDRKDGLKEQCDEKILLLQLARLYIVSPEKIILLLTNKNLQKTCQEVCDVLLGINTTIASGLSLPPENIYLRLYIDLTNYHDCMKELREDLNECDGPADWFEKTDKAIVCEYYNDIVNCQYNKAAMICGVKPAEMLRTFSMEIMRRVVMFKCRVSRTLPHIDEKMASAAAGSSSIRDTCFKC